VGEERWIRASETQNYSYCARAWWLQHILDLDPEERGQMREGVGQHRSHSRRVVGAERVQRIGLYVLLLALAIGAVALVWLLGRGA
jgi:hypothetical protein